MKTYLFFHRIRGPVIIVVVGITALLNQWHVLTYGQSWPLYLIAIGLLQLAERAAWSRMRAGMPPPGFWGGAAGMYPNPGPYPGPNAGPEQSQGQDAGRRGNWGGPSGSESHDFDWNDEGRK